MGHTMAGVKIYTEVECSWVCRGCGDHLFSERLELVEYEVHASCYTSDPLLLKEARTSGMADVYSFMASETYMVGHTYTTILAPHAPIINEGRRSRFLTDDEMVEIMAADLQHEIAGLDI